MQTAMSEDIEFNKIEQIRYKTVITYFVKSLWDQYEIIDTT